MDQYIPPIYAVGTGILIVILCFYMRIPFFVVGILSLVLVVYALQDHFFMFAKDYKSFSAPEFLKQNASVLIIAVVILLSIGFIIFKFGPKGMVSNQPMVYGRQIDDRWYNSLLNRKV